jgi:NAD(P)H-hydrate epimerase
LLFEYSTPIDSSTPTLSIAALRDKEAQSLGRGLPLMQRAGQAAAEWAVHICAPPGQVLALVGPGNNGGDALVAARLLLSIGLHVTVVMPLVAEQSPADALQALADWQALGQPTFTTLPEQKPDMVIDGLFGIGLSRPLAEPFQRLIDAVNTWQTNVLALDLASGVDAETGSALGRPINATQTIAFIAPCHAFQAPCAQPFLGQCRVASLNI